MNTLAQFFLRNSKFTAILSFGLIVFGLMGLMRMNAESYPAVSLATATIITNYDGASAEDIEIKITKPLEDEIRSVAGLKDVKSISQAGLSTIVVRIDMDDPNVDVDEAMGDVQKAIVRTTKLPNDLRDPPVFTEVKSEEFPVMELALVGSNTNRNRDLSADALKEELEDLRGVKDVRLVGFSPRTFLIQIIPDQMKKYHIGLDEVMAAVQSRNSNTPGGALKSDDNQVLLRVEGKIRNNDELKNLVVRSNFSGQTILLKDLANVVDDEDEKRVMARHNGVGATILIVTKKSGADTLKLVSSIDEKVALFKKRHADLSLNIYSNEGKKVANRLEVLASNAITGLVLVVIFLFFFLPGKIGVAASLSLPMAVLGTMGFMPTYGMNLDTITILALVIALGMLVDNSVVISENFTRLRVEGLTAKEAASKSIHDLWLPITATAFTTIAAFLPMLVTKGVMGQFIRYIPIIVTISLILSLAESFFFLPIRLRFAGAKLSKKQMNSEGDWFKKFENKFENLMQKLVRVRYLMLLGFVGIIVVSFYFMSVANKFILFPADQTEIYLARIETPKGTRLEKTDRVISEIAKRVKDILGEDAKHVVGRAGVAKDRPADPKGKDGNNVGMITIFVSDHMKNNIPHTEVLAKLRKIKHAEVASLSFETIINGPPVGNPIEATFRSNNIENLYSLINKIKSDLEKVNGIFDLKIDDVIGDDEIFIDLDYQKASRLGLDVRNIGQVVRAAISSRRLSTVTLDNKDVDIKIQHAKEFRRDLENLDMVKVMDRQGNLIPITAFATFQKKSGAPQIKRFDFKRSKTLTGDVNDDVITSAQANKILISSYEKYKSEYPDISLSFGGAAESTKESMESLFSALILSLIGILALLVFIFGSYLRPLIIMSTIPLGLFGFSIAFSLHGRPISFLALIGIIGLGGIIVNSGIVLISFIDQLKEENPEMIFSDILAKASGMRLRAVVVTSLTTISGLLPTAYGIGGSDAILIPMTLAMAWGLTSGTILTIIWVPCAYAILEDFTNWFSALLKNRKPLTAE